MSVIRWLVMQEVCRRLNLPRGPQLVVRAYEILKSDEYNEDFRISSDFHWDFRITQALVGISDYKQNFARYCEISGKIFKNINYNF